MKTCTMIKKGKELNENIESTSCISFRGCLCHPSDSSCKATGPDEVPAEVFSAGGETVLDRMHRICVAIWETREWSEQVECVDLYSA